MSYVNNRSRRSQRRRALGDTLSDYISKGGTALKTVTTILDDPALPQVATIVMDLHDLEPKTPAGAPSPGLGLNKLVMPLKAYRYTRRHWWAMPAAIGVVVGVPFLLGYSMGKGRR